MTSPFTGTDELGATRQDGAEKYFLLYLVFQDNLEEIVTFDLCNAIENNLWPFINETTLRLSTGILNGQRITCFFLMETRNLSMKGCFFT